MPGPPGSAPTSASCTGTRSACWPPASPWMTCTSSTACAYWPTPGRGTYQACAAHMAERASHGAKDIARSGRHKARRGRLKAGRDSRRPRCGGSCRRGGRGDQGGHRHQRRGAGESSRSGQPPRGESRKWHGVLGILGTILGRLRGRAVPPQGNATPIPTTPRTRSVPPASGCPVPAPGGGPRSPQRICPRRARPIPAD
jgi:hypothetical protein